VSLASFGVAVGQPLVPRTVLHGRMGVRWTAEQQSILDQLDDDRLVLCNRTLTRADLCSIFRGEQLPRDPALCEALGLYKTGHAR
jgi:hypothetical protein